MAYQQSIKLVNFAQLLTDIGPVRHVRGLRELNGTEILSQDLLAKEALLSRKVTLEEGDISSSGDDSDYEIRSSSVGNASRTS